MNNMQNAQLFQLMESVRTQHQHVQQVIGLLTMPDEARNTALVGLNKLLKRAEDAAEAGALDVVGECYVALAKYQMPHSVEVAYQERLKPLLTVDHNRI